jgi:hypothetical protein
VFWKKKPQKSVQSVNVENHIREFLFDCQIPEANVIALALGSPHISRELIEKEETESDRRVAPIEPLFPLLEAYATLISEGVIAAQKNDADVESVPESFWLLTRKLLEMVSLNILVGTLSQLNEMDFIEVHNVKKY